MASARDTVSGHMPLPDGAGERLSGYDVMGLAFDTGSYLVLRLATASFDVFDPLRHRPATPGRAETIHGGAR